jgi:hypothetical protein
LALLAVEGAFWPQLFGWKKLLILEIEFEIDCPAADVNVLRERCPEGVLKTAPVPASKAAPPTYIAAPPYCRSQLVDCRQPFQNY